MLLISGRTATLIILKNPTVDREWVTELSTLSSSPPRLLVIRGTLKG